MTVAAVIERNGQYLLTEEHAPEGLRLNDHLAGQRFPLSVVQTGRQQA